MGLHPDTSVAEQPIWPRDSGIIEGALVVYGLAPNVFSRVVDCFGQPIFHEHLSKAARTSRKAVPHEVASPSHHSDAQPALE